MKKMNRRAFLQSSAAVGALSGIKVARAGGSSPSNQPIIIDLFMRGGMDGLNVVPPFSGPNRNFYEQLRPDIQVPLTGTNRVLDIGEAMGFHPAASGLRDMYLGGDLAIIHGTGLPQENTSRSHFDAMKLRELGTPSNISTSDGWLTRHLNSTPHITGSEIIPVLVSNGSNPISLQAYYNALTVDQVGGYNPNSGDFAESHASAIGEMYQGNSALDQSVGSAMDTLGIISALDLDNYTPAGGANYPDSTFGRQLSLIAQLVKEDLDINVATADLGGWDTHNGQGDGGGGSFYGKVDNMSESVRALWQDLKASGLGDQVTIVVHSEFGRRARQNGQGNSGTDHGSGNVMFLIGGKINGGYSYGQFIGLANDELFGGEDIAPVVDFRRVFSTILQEIMGNSNISYVFPGYENHVSMNFTAQEVIFKSGFE
ncbi:DUF1501 domain-containing protein [Marinicella sp. S1101]|uniref:DUF1501 domain-containing protein n=1 Tax=Marinicella marina TaxID=2996016 RepID=UPI002260B76F|nr:DUF1501 domain-containing protein [Marinicella marina]MCX7553558.1 DUF1501 domain-containing protein [Marinicella marina]MDJ1140182.1 DUF1501 domain-containing protein [Marinicella marina]